MYFGQFQPAYVNGMAYRVWYGGISCWHRSHSQIFEFSMQAFHVAFSLVTKDLLVLDEFLDCGMITTNSQLNRNGFGKQALFVATTIDSAHHKLEDIRTSEKQTSVFH